MCRVSSLKSLSLKAVADFIWEVLKIRAEQLEPTLGLKITNLLNVSDRCRFHSPFLICIKVIALLIHNVLNSKLSMNSIWNRVKPIDLETVLKQLNDYLRLPPSLKQELSHVLCTQYDFTNLFQVAVLIETGYHFLDFQDYLHLNGNLKLLSCLELGKQSIKKLTLRQCIYNCSACKKLLSVQAQERLMKSFPYLQELTANGNCCNDSTLNLISKHCQHLKKLKVKNALCVTDRGISYLCLPQSVVKTLSSLSVCNTNVSVKGAEKALVNLPCLEKLDCSNHMDTVELLRSLSEQELVFDQFRTLSLIVTDETEKKMKCRKLLEKIPSIFPNLLWLTIETEVSIEPECLLFLQSLEKIEDLQLTLNYMEATTCLFPCQNYYYNFHPQMNSLTILCLCLLDDVCIHAVLNVTPCLQYLTIQDVIDSGCTHRVNQVNSSVKHLALIGSGEAVVEKCLALCSSTETLAIVDYDEMHFKLSSKNMLNLTHLSLDCLHMDTAMFLVDNCKNLQVLNLINQLRGSEVPVWFQAQRPFVKVMYHDIDYDADWFVNVKFSPCSLCQAFE